MPSTRNAYDHRLRELICHTNDVELAVHLGVHRSTAKNWLQRGPRDVLTADVLDVGMDELRAKVLYLNQKNQALQAIIRLLLVLARVTGMRLYATRIPGGARKRRILSAVARATQLVPRNVALHLAGLTPARYHAWRRAAPCHLDDRSSCPKTRPTQLGEGELRIMRDMVRSQDFRHFSIRALALHAQRIGRVFAAPDTWTRQILRHGWLRPRFRLHPPKPTEGIRTTRPNELWHMDVTLIRLLDGTRLYLHAVIDNYSRKLLGWGLVSKLDPPTTCRMLETAGRHFVGLVPTVMLDSGVENVNNQVDELLDMGKLRRVLAQVEVSYSNSMIEACWNSSS